MIINPSDHPYSQIYKLMTGLIVPRPIAFVSTINNSGTHNLAPFSFFSGVCSNPPIICFSTAIRPDKTHKDTYNNIKATRQFVVNLVTEDLAKQMNECSADFSPEVDEFAVSGLTPERSDLIKAPRVKESPVNMECILLKIVDFGEDPGCASTIFGNIVRFHIADKLVDNFHIDPDRLKAIGRMGGPTYSLTRERFELPRPPKPSSH
jgi:flavin reductase (DIM6/NTAB) family NADH-FMN oxidoreductase RutF